MARIGNASLVRLTPLSPNEPRGYEGVVSSGGESSGAHVNFIDWAAIGTIVAGIGTGIWNWWQGSRDKHDKPSPQPPSPPPQPPQSGINTTGLLVAIVVLAAVFFIARR
jgi:hypothetical protein